MQPCRKEARVGKWVVLFWFALCHVAKERVFASTMTTEFQAVNKVKVSGNNARAFLHYSAIILRMAKTIKTTTTTTPPSFGCFTLLGRHSRTNPTLLLSHESLDDARVLPSWCTRVPRRHCVRETMPQRVFLTYHFSRVFCFWIKALNG
jgi:hypothetical protein